MPAFDISRQDAFSCPSIKMDHRYGSHIPELECVTHICDPWVDGFTAVVILRNP